MSYHTTKDSPRRTEKKTVSGMSESARASTRTEAQPRSANFLEEKTVGGMSASARTNGHTGAALKAFGESRRERGGRYKHK